MRRKLIVAAVATAWVSLSVFALSQIDQSPLTQQEVVVPSPSEDSAVVDFHEGRWIVDGVTVPLRCPTEDSCSVDYRDGAWRFAPQVP